MIVGLLDILKIVLPTFALKILFPEQPAYAMLAAVGGLMGHIWPVYYHFHGGSGFSAILGGLLVINWPAAIILPIAGLLLGMVVFRNMVVASLSWIWLIIPWFWWRTDGDPAYMLYAVAVNIIFLLAMIPDVIGEISQENIAPQIWDAINDMCALTRSLAGEKDGPQNPKVCEFCGTANDPSLESCAACGAGLPSDLPRKCPKCGRGHTSEALFCQACGTRLVNG